MAHLVPIKSFNFPMGNPLFPTGVQVPYPHSLLAGDSPMGSLLVAQPPRSEKEHLPLQSSSPSLNQEGLCLQ